MLIFFVLTKTINKICTCLAKHKFARLIGMFFYEPDARQNLKNNFIKLFMEVFFDNCFCAFLNLTALLRAKDPSLFFITRDDIFSSMMTIFHVVTLLAFPSWVYFQIKAKLGYLDFNENV